MKKKDTPANTEELEEFIEWCNERITHHIKKGNDEAAQSVERGRDAVIKIHWSEKKR